MFSSNTIKFLRQIKKNNKRNWFEKNKPRYEDDVRTPALEFISEMGPLLKKLSPYFLAVPKKVGGSLMRVYRDTRFSKDKTPYKTNIGIQFRHEFGKDVHAPGYYLHIEPDDCFLGLGIWRPDSATLKKIRDHIQQEPDAWKKTVGSKSFRSHFELAGESLKKAPMGVEKDHPQIVDLRRKDFIGVAKLSIDTVLEKNFAKNVIDQFKKGNRLMSFLCDAIRVPF